MGEIERLLEGLRDLSTDLPLIDLPEGVDDLYNPDITDWENTAAQDFANQQALDLDRLFNPDLRIEQEINDLFRSRDLPITEEEVNRIARELEEALKNMPPRVPDNAREAEALRIMLKYMMIEIAMKIAQIEELLKTLENLAPAYVNDIRIELNALRRTILQELGYLFGDNPEIIELFRRLLWGELTIEAFEAEYVRLLPPITWSPPPVEPLN